MFHSGCVSTVWETDVDAQGSEGEEDNQDMDLPKHPLCPHPSCLNKNLSKVEVM